ncbi:MAG: GGDEF domain-containing protein [Desulfurivibrio sp.]|nr:GGDEF domain-containing protein [Desulfurivibrio sp.]
MMEMEIPIHLGRPSAGGGVPRWLSLLLTVVGLAALYYVGLHNYLLFHSLAEIFSIVIAGAIFIIAWNSREHLADSYLYLLGIAYLFIGFLDLMHTLSYKGMQIFTDYDFYANQLWIATRFLESLTLLAAFFLVRRRITFRPYVLEAGYAVVTGLILLSIFQWRLFPICFIEGVGQTPFKIWSEFVICAILGLATWLAYRHRQLFSPQVFGYLMVSLVCTILSELSFTFYVSNYGFSNMVGHYFKIASFYMVYRAIVLTGIRSPYQLIFKELKAKEAELERQAAIDELTDLFNRRAALALLGKQLGATQREHTPLTICYLDLDGLKQVNDTFGHAEGDIMLKIFAGQLVREMRAGDYACRMGGDEFLLILPHCPEGEAARLIERIEERLALVNSGLSKSCALVFSYGIAQWDEGDTMDQLLELADTRMYAQKAEKKETAAEGASPDTAAASLSS